MLTPDPASLLSHQAAIFGNIERVLNNPIPDFCSGLPKLDRAGGREWLTGPFLTIARQFVVPPPSDDPGEDPAFRGAALLLRLAHKVVCHERTTNMDEQDEPSEQLASLTGTLDWEIQRRRLAPRADREELNRALCKVAQPLLPRTHDEMYAWVVEGIAPGRNAITPAKPQRIRTKGRDINVIMIKTISNNRDSIYWTARQWAKHLNCSDGTIKGTKTWKAIRAVCAEGARASSEKMDTSRLKPSGGSRHRK